MKHLARRTQTYIHLTFIIESPIFIVLPYASVLSETY